MGLENPIHLAVIALIVLLLFGAKRLPEMGASLGNGMRSFKDAVSGESRHAAITDPLPAPTPAPVEHDDVPSVTR